MTAEIINLQARRSVESEEPKPPKPRKRRLTPKQRRLRKRAVAGGKASGRARRAAIEEAIGRAKAMRAAGDSVAAIAEELGRGTRTIYHWLRL